MWKNRSYVNELFDLFLLYLYNSFFLVLGVLYERNCSTKGAAQNLQSSLRRYLSKSITKFSVLHYLHGILKNFVLHQMKLTDYVLTLQISRFSLAHLLVWRVPSLILLSHHWSLHLYITFSPKVCKTCTFAILSLCPCNSKA